MIESVEIAELSALLANPLTDAACMHIKTLDRRFLFEIFPMFSRTKKKFFASCPSPTGHDPVHWLQSPSDHMHMRYAPCVRDLPLPDPPLSDRVHR